MWTGKTNFSRSILPQGTTSAAKVYLIYLVLLNWLRSPDTNFTNVASFIADSQGRLEIKKASMHDISKTST